MALQRDLLISVTSFFRDRGSVRMPEENRLPSHPPGEGANDTIRIWVAGCATGEEAFSIAISLQEYLNETGDGFSGADFCLRYQPAGNRKGARGQVSREHCGGHFP